MSSSIWTRCAGVSRIAPLALEPVRVVEAQHLVSTRKLVDSLAEQELLESLIEHAKPPDVTAGRLHYLLATPFRYPPLPHGSRFGTRTEPGIWYGSETLPAAFAEVAYYRLLFLDGTEADLGTVTTPLTAFTVKARTRRGLDLTAPPFDAHRSAISSRTRYGSSQVLGAFMRAAGVELFRYWSARDRSRTGINVAAFTPRVFGYRKPTRLETWHCTATRQRVEMRKRDYFARESFTFERREFEVRGTLPAPAC